MPEPAISVILLDPYHPVTGLLVPFVAQRMREVAEAFFVELSPDTYVREIMVRLWNRDPRVMVVALCDPKGNVVGHGVATIETDGINSWCFVSQVKADGNVGDAVHQALEMANEWARQAGCRLMLMATGRSERAWERAYGFKVDRRIMSREIISSQKG